LFRDNFVRFVTGKNIWTRAIAYMFLFGCSWFVVLPALLLLLYRQFPPVLRSGAWITMGGALFLLGGAFSWLAAYHLVAFGRGTPFPLDPTRTLVISGPYRYVRNPQAIATVLMVLGEIAAFRSIALLWLIPFTILYLELLAAPYEDRELLLRYGEAYLQYRDRVPKWFPFPRL
jgi:protein-S-isoprenylcysteine O-methyltransferase Ste14